MRTRYRIAIPGAVAAVAALVVTVSDPGGPWGALLLLGAAIVAGELLTLRPTGRTPLPLSYAVMMVVLRAATPVQFLVTVTGAELVAALVRRERGWARVRVTLTRLVAAVAALGAYRLVLDHVTGPDLRAVTFLALTAAGLATIVVDDVVTMIVARRFAIATEGRTADLALVTSGLLMAISYDGIGSAAGMGLWGPLLCSVPLVAAWYAFARLASIRSTYEQTITALSVVPELAGLARPGHAERVADLSVAVAHELGLERQEVEYVRAAALLHHLGHLCLDDPEVRGAPVEAWEVTDKGAEILRQTDYLAPAGDLLASSSTSLGGHVLRVASAFDELTEGDVTRGRAAVEALHLGPGYIYDERVLVALERVVQRASIGLVPA